MRRRKKKHRTDSSFHRQRKEKDSIRARFWLRAGPGRAGLVPIPNHKCACCKMSMMKKKKIVAIKIISKLKSVKWEKAAKIEYQQCQVFFSLSLKREKQKQRRWRRREGGRTFGSSFSSSSPLLSFFFFFETCTHFLSCLPSSWPFVVPSSRRAQRLGE